MIMAKYYFTVFYDKLLYDLKDHSSQGLDTYGTFIEMFSFILADLISTQDSVGVYRLC